MTTDLHPLIRLARPADAASLARVETQTWRDAYPTLLPEQFLVRGRGTADSWRQRLRGEPRRVVVAEASRRVVAYASWGAVNWGGGTHRDRDAAQLHELYVYVDHRGIGVGRSLCAEVARRLLEEGRTWLDVEVLDGNPARYFYETLGAHLVARAHHDFAGQRLPTFIYRWNELDALAGQKI